MKLLLDQGLPRSAASLLRDANIDTIHVGEIGMSAARDIDIIKIAGEEGRIARYLIQEDRYQLNLLKLKIDQQISLDTDRHPV